MKRDPRLVVALDRSDLGAALTLAERLDPERCAVKVGKELFCRAGPEAVRALVARGFRVFLDLKFHDIPQTVARAVAAAADLGAWMVDLHALGGRRMMEAAAAALARSGAPTRLVAVTVLTSMDAAALREVGIDAEPEAQVLRLADLAAACGLHGVVCSPWEAAAVAARRGPDFLRVTPGIRPVAATDDQVRVMAPAAALAAGATHLVVGRPIAEAPDPAAAALAILAEMGEA